VSYNFIRYDQDQQHLLPKSINDWVEEDSLERFVSDVLDYLDEEGRLEPGEAVEAPSVPEKHKAIQTI
jgi:hypothetical protein